MNESHPRFSLIDIMRGVHALGLYTKLPDAQFKFFIGLILKCNELAFKSPIELTNIDASALGGGETKQSLHSRRSSLAKQRVYGNWLMRFTPGDRWSKRSSSYRINLEFLSAEGKAWERLRESWSTQLAQEVAQDFAQEYAQEETVSFKEEIRVDPQDRAGAREGAGKERVQHLDINVAIRQREDEYANPYDWIHLVGDEANRIFEIFRFYEDEDTDVLKQALINANLDDDIVLRKVADAKDQGIPPRKALAWVRDQLGGAS